MAKNATVEASAAAVELFGNPGQLEELEPLEDTGGEWEYQGAFIPAMRRGAGASTAWGLYRRSEPVKNALRLN